ncbi:aldehyde dehydrogenase family protein [bacterium]|nr:MAG: aldehyde dehydrogenase family protein [bacterium]
MEIAGELEVHQHFIDGAPSPGAGGRTYDLVDPATGEAAGRAARGDADDVARAIAAARRAFQDGRWSGLGVARRARILNAFADAIEAALPHLSDVETRYTGRPIREMRAQLSRLPEWYRYFAAVARSRDDTVTPFEGPYHNYARRVPIGVVAQVTPWNHPLLILAKKLAPALAAGNCVVIKPSEFTPVTTLMLAQIAKDAGVPDGVMNVVTGYGSEAGAALTHSKGIDKIDLTGGTETGRAVAQAAGANLILCSCELGGKAPMLVLPGADLDAAAAGAVFAAFIAAGQTCIAGTRILVQERMIEPFLQRFLPRVRSLRLGLPQALETQLGPLVAERQLARTQEYVGIAIAEGATVACGGKRPDDPVLAGGFFYEPTVLTGVTNDMRVAQDEIFGPVTCVIGYRDEDHAVSIANDIRYGLGASVWTSDAAQGMRVAHRLECGIVWINDHHRIDPSSVWGGFKASGIGHENGHEAYREYTKIQSIVVNLGAPPDWYGTTDVVRLS